MRSALLALAVLAIAAPAAGAATITVTTKADPVTPVCPSASTCSLRGAAAAAADGDVIVLGAGTYALTQGELVLDHGVTIRGAGRSATTIDASGVAASHHVIRVRGVVTHNVTFRGLAITGGALDTTGDNNGGGGIAYNDQQEPLYLHDVRVYGNTVVVANASNAGGGGIRSEGSVYMTDTVVEGNTVTITDGRMMDGGGGVYLSPGSGHADLVMANSIVRQNTATVAAIAPSGINECEVPIPDTTCPSNHGGGGVYVGREDLAMTDSAIRGNTLTVTNAFAESGGGGAFVEAGDATVVRSSISGNTASVATTTDATRPASNEGGGALYLNGHDIVLDGATIAGNALTVTGGTTTSDQDATNGGGGIYQFGNRIVITGSTVSGNTATVPASIRSGGGGLYDNGNAETVLNSTFQGNRAVVGPDSETDPGYLESNGGGAIFLVGVGAGVQLSYVTIAGNSAPSAAGGGILSYTNASATWPLVGNSIVAGNTSAIAASGNCWSTQDAQITSLGWNIADDAANSCDFTAEGDRIADPLLGPLASNGGQARTMALRAGSPAIDGADPATCGTPSGAANRVDERGAARPGAATDACDVGAYELETPVAQTMRAIGLGRTSATLTGTACNGDAKAGSAWFQYGRTRSYTRRTPRTPLKALACDVAVARGLTGLAPGRYHYRLVVRNAVGTARGADRVLVVPQRRG